ncbi:jg18648 [Pararge aegeria aegeria]|uniref:Jg18648 protein n=1 Tax=Pararge aegeria aegeria TaxID=348720 RepID=A0A8S4REY7_9NEOP|nr:jg18648 [Pararge aegeria aegeria]
MKGAMLGVLCVTKLEMKRSVGETGSHSSTSFEAKVAEEPKVGRHSKLLNPKSAIITTNSDQIPHWYTDILVERCLIKCLQEPLRMRPVMATTLTMSRLAEWTSHSFENIMEACRLPVFPHRKSSKFKFKISLFMSVYLRRL